MLADVHTHYFPHVIFPLKAEEYDIQNIFNVVLTNKDSFCSIFSS